MLIILKIFLHNIASGFHLHNGLEGDSENTNTLKRKFIFVRFEGQTVLPQNWQKFRLLLVFLVFLSFPFAANSQSSTQSIFDKNAAINVVGDAIIFDAASESKWEEGFQGDEETVQQHKISTEDSKANNYATSKKKKENLFSEKKKLVKEKAEKIAANKPEIVEHFSTEKSPNSTFQTVSGIFKSAVWPNKHNKNKSIGKRFSYKIKKKKERESFQKKYFYVAHFCSYNYSLKFSVRPPPVS